jgi:integrase
MRTRANAISNTALSAKWQGKPGWLTDGGTRGAGRLVARLRGAEGWQFFFQYFKAEDKRLYLPIGPYDSSGKRGVSLQAARDRAAALSTLYRNGTVNLHEHFERQHEAKERAHRAAQEAAQREQEQAKASTLRLLLDGYVKHLERGKKQSAADVRRIFNTHVYEPAPDLAERKAADVTVEDFVGLIGKVVEAGKGRTAAKMRSYLRAAYSMAIRAQTDPAMPSTFRSFGITANPLASIGALSEFNNPRKRHLSAPELRAFLLRLAQLPESKKKSALALNLLLGVQRAAQLLSVKPADMDLDGGVITLYDRKGKRKTPREHKVPLTKRACVILEGLLADLPEGAQFLFTSDGKTHLRTETVSEIVSQICADMVKAKEVREPFEMRDLRKTCETMLASLGVSSDVRGMLQSHGLGGIQKRHYDFHDYALEMREALTKWARHLERVKAGESAKVLSLKSANK